MFSRPFITLLKKYISPIVHFYYIKYFPPPFIAIFSTRFCTGLQEDSTVPAFSAEAGQCSKKFNANIKITTGTKLMQQL